MTNNHPWYILSYPMGSEASVLEESLKEIEQLPEGGIAVLPEYIAYTVENSMTALEAIKEVCVRKKVSVITTLNIIPTDLPHAISSMNYNTLVIVTKEGEVHTPQAKVTPQSFERVQYDPKFPAMNVGDYDYFNRVQLEIDGKIESAFFIICSDVYGLMAGVEDVSQLKADYCIVPGNFGNGAEQAVYRTLGRFREAGIFKKTIFSNPYQVLRKPTQTPLVQKATAFEQRADHDPLVSISDWERIQLMKNNVAIYPDEQVPSFVHMASLTMMDEGRMTIGMSRMPITIKVGTYDKIIKL